MCHGLLLGALAAFAIFKIARFARYGGCGGGWGGGRWRGGWRHHSHHRHGGGGPWFLRWLFEDLETTPSQERNIKETFADLREKAKDTKAEWKNSVEDLASALTADELDHEKVGEAWVKQDKALDTIRMAAIEALGKIHGTLDATQRERLAEIIRRRASGRWRDTEL